LISFIDYLLLNKALDVREIVWEEVDWINVAQDRNQWRDLVNTVMSLLVP
jgi:hypothetical protein